MNGWTGGGDERRRGQTAPLGIALLTVVVIFGSVSVVVFGGSALESTQQSSDIQRTEHVLTLFDSRAAMVALGDSDSQRIRFSGSGSYEVSPDSGRIQIIHENYSNNSNIETIYDAKMGAVVYSQGETQIAYQGGGVWRKGGSGGARMVTPPEFHFRKSTLTFPLVRVTNSDSGAGSIHAEVSADKRAVPVYPNNGSTAQANYDGSGEVGAPYDPSDGTEHPYENPLTNGSLYVKVHSEYCEGWRDYFRSRTQAKVSECEDGVVRADLISVGDRGPFTVPQDGNGIRVAGQEGDHSLKNLTLTLRDDPNDDAQFNNLEWSMYVDNGQRQYEFNLVKGGKVDGVQYLRLTVYYSDDNGNTYQGWVNDTAFPVQEGDWDNDGDEDSWAHVNLSSKTTELEYSSVTSSGLTHFDNPGSLQEPGEWTAHSTLDNESGQPFSTGDRTSVYNVTAHYLSIVGEEYFLTVDDKSGDRVKESSSRGEIDYDSTDKYIAYLHVTENEVKVEFN